MVGALAVVTTLPLLISNVYLQRTYDAANPTEALGYVEVAQTFNPVDPEIYVREAELAIESGEWERVEESYRAAIRRNPRHYETYMFLGDFYQRRGELAKARELYEEALNRNPLEPELQYKISRLGDQPS
jgi:tetratricopeptide (TPR) repeat protein